MRLNLGSCLLVLAAASPAAAQNPSQAQPAPSVSLSAPSPDPRIGLKAGLTDAGTATWNMRLVRNTAPAADFVGVTNSDLAFSGKYAFQGNYNGFQVWDISDPSNPSLAVGYLCPASQSDVSVYRNLLIVSGEGLGGRLDCGKQGVSEHVSKDRLRGVRIFDISDIAHPKNVGNVQTCRGSHTHTLLVDPKDPANVYVYISGSAPVRPDSELVGCSSGLPSQNPTTAQFRIEVIRIPLAHPEQAAIVSSPRIFNDLVEAPTHGQSAADREEVAAAKARGGFTAVFSTGEEVVPDRFANSKLDSIMKARGGTTVNGADSAAFRAMIPTIVSQIEARRKANASGPRPGPTQCHDITVYPAIGLAGGACEGYGMLLDISDPVNPKRLAAVSDSNFSYWHSATFNNDGTKLLFSDEWGGGGQPKCRADDPKDWGADAIFTVANRQQLQFGSYYKMPAPQTVHENCVAHNGSMIPVPGRDIMVQAWYQGGVSVFDFTDPKSPKEIAFFDRGPVDSTKMAAGGSWSAYWYNGAIYSSEISRGLDVLELTPGPLLTQNELDAAKSVKLDYLNVQGQQKFVWPTTFSLARAYADQLERSKGLSAARLTTVRSALDSAEKTSGSARSQALHRLGGQIDTYAAGSSDAARVKLLASTVHALASAR